MELLIKLKKYKILLFVVGLIIAIICGGKDSNYWGLTNPSGEEILDDIEKGKIDVKTLRLNNNQLNEIKILLQKNPKRYNDVQKSILLKKTGKEILLEVGLGFQTLESIHLTPLQKQEIKELILQNPNKYSVIQKELLPELKSKFEQISKNIGMKSKETIVLDKTGKEILIEVGNGNYEPNEIKLTPSQYKEIKNLLLNNPNRYNSVQKELIPEIKHQLDLIAKNLKNSPKTVNIINLNGEEILYEVGWGNIMPNDIKLTPDQLNEIKLLIKKNPNNYNDNQKSLIK